MILIMSLNVLIIILIASESLLLPTIKNIQFVYK